MAMKNAIKTFDELPFLVKLLFCIPALNIVWWVYRIMKSLDEKNNVALVIAIILLVVGIPFWWIIDLVCLLVSKKIWWLC